MPNEEQRPSWSPEERELGLDARITRAFANSEPNGHQHYRIAMEEGWRAVRQVAKGA